MKETRKIRVANKIIKINDAKKIAKLFLLKCEELKKKKKSVMLKYSVDCSDDTAYESDNPTIFDQDIISSKKIMSLEFALFGYGSNSRATLELEHGRDWSQQFIKLESDDGVWVNDFSSKFMDILNGITDQSNLVKKYHNLMRLGGVFFFSWLFYYMFSLFIKLSLNGEPYSAVFNSAGTTLTVVFMLLVPAIGCTEMILSRMSDLWPDIEIQIGPEFRQIERVRRTQFFAIVSILVVPILIEAIKLLF